MYTTCIIWLAFVPIYFGTGNSFEVIMNQFTRQYLFKTGWFGYKLSILIIVRKFKSAESDKSKYQQKENFSKEKRPFRFQSYVLKKVMLVKSLQIIICHIFLKYDKPTQCFFFIFPSRYEVSYYKNVAIISTILPK